jgi:hypothetical protein
VTGEIGGKNMKIKIWTGLLIVGVGCGEVTAEPIRTESLSITRVEIEAADSEDPYACEVLPVSATEPDELDLVSFVRIGDLAYTGRCHHLSPEHPGQCWYTSNLDCAPASAECGGFIGSYDPAADDYQLAGGQHMICPYPCVQDADCPAGSSGTARPSCMHGPVFDPATEGGQCMLGCGSGETCPDGFVCIQPGLAFGAADGTSVPAPAQCVQFHRLTLHGDPTPP